MLEYVAEVVYFVADPERARDWYARLVDAEPLDGPPRLRTDNLELTFHRADAQSGAGTDGQVAYFRVDSLRIARARLEAAGAVLFRGPLVRRDGRTMAQFKDPFGNAIGVVGS